MPTVAFKDRVAHAGAPAAAALEDGVAEAAADGTDAVAAADGDDDAAEDGASVRLDAEDDEDEHPVAKAATAIKPAVPVSVSIVRCSVIVASSSLRSPSGPAESQRLRSLSGRGVLPVRHRSGSAQSLRLRILALRSPPG